MTYEQHKAKLQAEVDRLTAVPDSAFFAEVTRSWWGSGPDIGPFRLFGFISKTGKSKRASDNANIGCITAIHNGALRAETDDLTMRIRADTRIPQTSEITKESLPVFMEWQLRAAQELGRYESAV